MTSNNRGVAKAKPFHMAGLARTPCDILSPTSRKYQRMSFYSHLAISPAESPVAAAICSGESFIAFKLRTV